jgi:hypothetical protein
MQQDQATAAAELNRLNQLRQVAVVIALVLLAASFITPSFALAAARSAAWAAAGVLSLLHTSRAKRAGLQASYLNAFLYLVVAALPLLRR